MKTVLCLLLLLFSLSVFAQQPAPTPGATPPTFPQDKNPKNPSQDMPPDTVAPAPAAKPTSGEVQQQINQKLADEPRLKDTGVKFDVDDRSVVVGGSVADEEQHQLALRLARSYAGDRKVEDYVKVGQGQR
ncbi:MAG TPA: BON domain-containing protein [Terriglobales bacterium]|nr:BON domain-containing protein [Terriglobales bacterium]